MCKLLEGVNEKTVFDGMDAGFERSEGIIRVNGDDFLRQHGTGVHAFIRDEMNHDARVCDRTTLVRFEGAFDGMNPRESAGQGRVQIDHTVRETIQKRRSEEAHPTRQHHPIGLIGDDHAGKLGIVSRASLGWVFGLMKGRDVRAPCAFEAKGLSSVGDDGHDLSVEFAGGAGVENGL